MQKRSTRALGQLAHMLVVFGIVGVVLPTSLNAQGPDASNSQPREIPTTVTPERLAPGAERPPKLVGQVERTDPPIPESHRLNSGRKEVVSDIPHPIEPPPLSLLFKDRSGRTEGGALGTYVLPKHLRPDAATKQFVQGDPKAHMPTPAQLAATYSQKGGH